ncbi:unnamed protein product [Arctogadus glacialis]
MLFTIAPLQTCPPTFISSEGHCYSSSYEHFYAYRSSDGRSPGLCTRIRRLLSPDGRSSDGRCPGLCTRPRGVSGESATSSVDSNGRSPGLSTGIPRLLSRDTPRGLVDRPGLRPSLARTIDITNETRGAAWIVERPVLNRASKWRTNGPAQRVLRIPNGGEFGDHMDGERRGKGSLCWVEGADGSHCGVGLKDGFHSGPESAVLSKTRGD